MAEGKVYDYPEQNPDYEGNETNSQLANGPLEERGCRDFFWCLIFLSMVVGLIFTSVYSFNNGNPERMLAPYGMNGSNPSDLAYQPQCGFGDASQFKYVYIVNSSNFYCVKSCPADSNSQLDCYYQQCPTNIFSTIKYFDNSQDEALAYLESVSPFGSSQQAMVDLRNSWPLQLANVFVAVILALILTVLLRYFAGCLVWVTIFLYFVMLIIVGVFCYESATNPNWSNSQFKSDKKNLLLGLAYTLWIVAGLSLLFFFCICNKIKLSIAVMKAAADFTREVCESIFVPLSTYIFLVLFMLYWIYLTIYLFATGTLISPQGTPFGSVSTINGFGWLIFYDIFCLYWTCNFIMAFAQFVIASACSMWYFSHLGEKQTLHHPITKSVVRGLFHHGGSIALGSLILALVGIIRLIFDQIHRAFKNSVMNNHGNPQEGCIKCWFCYCNYLLKIFEQFIRFLNQNAYIMIALNGKSFCSAAHDAYYLISRNMVRVAITHGLGEIFTVIGNLFIGITSTFIGYLMITQIDHFKNEIISPLLPIIIMLCVSMVIASLFMNVYGMAVDSILLCYLVDTELYKHEGGAKSIPPSLKEFLSEYK